MLNNKAKFISFCTAILLFLLGFLLIKTGHNKFEDNIDNLSTELVKTHALIVERTITRNTSSASILGSYIELVNGDVSHFKQFSHVLMQELKGVTNLQLAPDGVVSYIYPLKGNEKAIGHDILKHDKRKKEALLAKKTNRLTVAGPFTLIQGGVAIVGRKPVYINEQFWGFSSALILMDDLIKATNLDTLKDQQFLFRLKRFHPDTNELDIFYGDTNFKNENVFTEAIKVPNGEWYLDVEYNGKYISNQFIIILYAINLFMAVLMSFLLYLYLSKTSFEE